MGAKKLEKFGGLLPAWDDTLVPEGQATDGSNCYLFSGALQGWRVPKLLRQLTSSTSKFAYRLPSKTQATAYAYLAFVGNPSPGDTVTIGDYTYTFVSSMSTNTIGYYVLIGASPLQTAQFLLNAVTCDNGLQTNAGGEYGENMAANNFVLALNNQLGVVNQVLPLTPVGPVMQIYAPDVGASYNTIPVSASTIGGTLQWLSDTAALTHTTNTYVGGANRSTDTSINANSSFLEFDDADTNVIKSQVAADAYERYYFVSPSQPPKYNTRRRIDAGLAAFRLGVPAPTVAPAVSVIGGGDSGTLGPTTSNGGTISVGGNTCYLLPVIASGTFLLDSVSFIPAASSNTVNWQAVVFEDANFTGSTPTTPGSLCNASPQNTGMTQGVTTTGTFTNPCTTIPLAVYWIGIMVDTTVSIEQADNTGSSVAFPQTFTAGPPDPAPAVSTGQADLVMWANLTTSAVQEARAYVYTYISAYGEEGPPSPFTLVNGWSNGTWNLQLTAPPPNDLGVLRNLAVIRVYRTVTGTTGTTTYFQVVDLAIGSLDPDAINFVNLDGAIASTIGVAGGYGAAYADNLSPQQVAVNLQLESASYYPPPTNLQGFLNLPNGGVAAFRNQEVWFCEPYLPHAWPFGYMQMCDYPIVGLGLTNGAVVACTTSVPFVLQGTNPAAVQVFKCSQPAPCLSRGSILSLDYGVVFMSPNGLMMVPNNGQLQDLSESWIKREDWDQLTPQKNTRAVFLAGAYYCWGTTNGTDTSVAQTGFTLELDTDIASFGVWPQPGGHRIGFMPLSSPIGNIDNVYNDPWSGQTCFIANGNIYFLDFTDTNYTTQPYRFMSKKYQEVAKKNYSAFRCFFRVPPNSPPTYNQAPNTAAPYDPSWNTLQPNQLGIFRVWASVNAGLGDGTMYPVTARELTHSGQLLRVQDGFKAEFWQFEIIARVDMSTIQVATSIQELGEV